ncbi:pyridoxal-dependent decarboxylase [Pseudomonas syringae pv. tagetis]|nr:pyridoxal-dependent decarboxylase [Pseudomonas syringae group genomosp. 7]UNB66300.1 PLP-dependent decarboxylase [Pseudomonas syringae pv. tagetis]
MMNKYGYHGWHAGELTDAIHAVANVLDDYVQDSQHGEVPVLRQMPPERLINHLGMRNCITSDGMTADELSAFIKEYLAQGTRLHHPGYMSHQCAVPDIGSAIADLVHGVSNNAMSLFEMGAAGVAAELVVTEWMLDKVGWSSNGSGAILVHGGSLANLTALLVARHHAFPEAWQHGTPQNAVILAPANAHVSVTRAASILGLGSRAVDTLPCDRFGRVIGAQVSEIIEAHHCAGRTVMAVVANACAAPTGLFDPLPEIARACHDARVWLHVDAAHGGSALLVPELRHRLEGIEQADSITWDAHKMLRTSTLAAAVLVRTAVNLSQAFQQHADYLFFDENRPGPDLMHYTIEGSKAELGLKVFLNLAHRGEAGLAAYVHSRHLAARRFWQMIRERKEFEALSEPESNLVCFRYADPPGGHSDQLHIAVRNTLMQQGTFHLASSFVDNRRWWRTTIMAPSTDDSTFSRLLDTLERTYHMLSRTVL